MILITFFRRLLNGQTQTEVTIVETIPDLRGEEQDRRLEAAKAKADAAIEQIRRIEKIAQDRL